MATAERTLGGSLGNSLPLPPFFWLLRSREQSCGLRVGSWVAEDLHCASGSQAIPSLQLHSPVLYNHSAQPSQPLTCLLDIPLKGSCLRNSPQCVRMAFIGETCEKEPGLDEVPGVVPVMGFTAQREEEELPCLLSGDGGGVIPFPTLSASRRLLPNAIFWYRQTENGMTFSS